MQGREDIHSWASSSTVVSSGAYYPSSPPVPVVSNQDSDSEDDCPVCLEPLSFSFRLPGEKPHIVPECGHALHEACFSAVYGPVPRSGVAPQKSPGVCGVCRRPMKVGDSDSGRSNKLAALTGMADRVGPNTLYPGRDTPAGSRSTIMQTPQPRSPNDDDPLDFHGGSIKSSGSGEQTSSYIVAPSIQARPEFSTITRTGDASQPLTCIVVVELPSRRNASRQVPGPVMSEYRPQVQPERQLSPGSRLEPPAPYSPHRPPSPQESVTSQAYSYNPTPQNGSPPPDSPFGSITEDLRNRIIDWKGHPLSRLGTLQMFDILNVRRDSLVREFFVYLFKEAIICVVEERKRSIGRLLGSETATQASQTKGVLRLKGRIYIKHIKRVSDTSVMNELSLTIDMEDERLESFILLFNNRSSLEAWRHTISGLVARYQKPSPSARHTEYDEFGGRLGSPPITGKAARMLSGSSQGTDFTRSSVSAADSILATGSPRDTVSSSTSQNSGPYSIANGRLAKMPEEPEDGASMHSRDYQGHPSPPVVSLVTPHITSGPSNSLPALPHPAMDVILIISLPPPNATRSTADLKLRVIKTSLDFILASLGGNDRLSIVTFEVGMGGRVRKTPFLRVGRGQGGARLAAFVSTIGESYEEGREDVFAIRTGKDEKTDVVTAVNHALDNVLQRKQRNSISGMLLVSDAPDSARRAQMDLVLARAEAANIAIHSFGYGRSHDPASLWLMSNHTSGTYTFVKEWYDLRDCLAGCLGGMMSIGLNHMKMHLKVVDGHRFRIRKVAGVTGAILSSDGRNVDIELGEIRYGEKKEMLVELDLDNTEDTNGRAGAGQSRGPMNGTDQYMQRLGIDSLSLSDSPSDLVDGIMDRMIDEVPVFELDGSFFDPQAGKSVSRLAHPVLLTVTLLPSPGSRPRTPSTPSDPVIVRRRMELLASDMITRTLVLASKKNFPQASKILSETKRILNTVLQNITTGLPPPSSNGSTIRNRKEVLTLSAVRALQSILQDIQTLSEALEENVQGFAFDQRNFGAQQAMILRDQKSWTGRTATEHLFWTIDNSIELFSRSTDWVGRE
ncbi:hypothetical protein SISSUDRAFT_984899 [Sistotremastrum suecicum HHB10207 ss-3]|uniref:RING-type domain-containing protein n=1 Tax=Sistotremastrum suecicum HHB10207 ss-3 TaxID=1314776 RepID=A0A166EB04_9AGAM|nr:hypothetical protein SISSUDRAFT_984899 [Sistotremastrum suecicum HHB10207 ss-3]